MLRLLFVLSLAAASPTSAPTTDEPTTLAPSDSPTTDAPSAVPTTDAPTLAPVPTNQPTAENTTAPTPAPTPAHPPTVVWGPNCIAVGAGLEAAVAGENARFSLTTLNYDNEIIYNNSTQIEIHLEGTSSLEDFHNGSYIVTVNSTVAGPQHELGVEINGQHARNSPFFRLVAPGAVDHVHSFAQGAGLKSGATNSTLQSAVYTRDRWNNAVANYTANQVHVTITGPSGSPTVTPVVTEWVGGQYNVSWIAPVRGSYIVQVTVNGGQIAGSPFDAEIDATRSPLTDRSKAAIAGGIIGGLVLLLLCFICWKYENRKRRLLLGTKEATTGLSNQGPKRKDYASVDLREYDPSDNGTEF